MPPYVLCLRFTFSLVDVWLVATVFNEPLSTFFYHHTTDWCIPTHSNEWQGLCTWTWPVENRLILFICQNTMQCDASGFQKLLSVLCLVQLLSNHYLKPISYKQHIPNFVISVKDHLLNGLPPLVLLKFLLMGWKSPNWSQSKSSTHPLRLFSVPCWCDTQTPVHTFVGIV